MAKSPDWTNRQAEFLQHNYGKMPTAALAENLHRSITAIYIMAHQLGLTRPEQHPARAKRTHCKRGHPLTPDNLYVKVRPSGREDRQCKACYREWPSTKAKVKSHRVSRNNLAEQSIKNTKNPVASQPGSGIG